MRLVLYESKGVDFVAGEGWKFVYLFEDVLGEVLGGRVKDVSLVSEDVFEGGAGDVVSELSLASFLHGIITSSTFENYDNITSHSSHINITVFTQNYVKSYEPSGLMMVWLRWFSIYSSFGS